MFQWIESESTTKRRSRRAAIVLSLAAVFFLVSILPGRAAGNNVWEPLTRRLVEDGFDSTYIESVFSRRNLVFSPEIMARKMKALLRTKLSTRQPGPAREPEVMDRYLNPILIAGAYAYYRDHKDDFAIIKKRYGVPGELLTALMLVETKLGRQIGRHKALVILSSMALGGDYSLIAGHVESSDLSPEIKRWLVKRTRQKGNWAYGELKALLTYAHDNGQDPLTIPSSMYGAIGVCQFIPSSAIHYGVDGTGDGRVDLFDHTDALHSMANYMMRNRWKPDLTREQQLKVVYRYNHSESYAMTILAVADKIRKTRDFFE